MAQELTQKSPATLGDVLYAKSKAPVPEQDWATLVQAIATGDQLALHALYEMAQRIVFTLVMRITANRETAEELTIDVRSEEHTSEPQSRMRITYAVD